MNIAVLRVREAPGLDAAVVGRVEHGEYGDILSGIHQDADGFRWWRVRFWNGADGWVADGDDELDYLVRTVDKQPLAPLVPLPPFEPLAERLLTAAGARQVMCPEAYRGTPGPVCAVGPERGTGSFESVAEPMRVPMVELLLAEGFRLAHDWEYDGNDIGMEISAAFTDGTRAVRLGIVDSAWEPLALVMIQQFHLWP